MEYEIDGLVRAKDDEHHFHAVDGVDRPPRLALRQGPDIRVAPELMDVQRRGSSSGVPLDEIEPVVEVSLDWAGQTVEAFASSRTGESHPKGH